MTTQYRRINLTQRGTSASSNQQSQDWQTSDERKITSEEYETLKNNSKKLDISFENEPVYKDDSGQTFVLKRSNT